jgi:hypothetical protein
MVYGAKWRERWLSKRIRRPEVLEAVASHHLGYPMEHGAAVRLPEADDAGLWDAGDLFYEPGDVP